MFICWQISLQSDCRSAHSAGLESAPADLPEFTAVAVGVPGVGTEDSTLLSGGAAALLEPDVPGKGSTGPGDAGTLLTASTGADGTEVASIDPGLPIADGLVPLPGEFGLLGEVIDSRRAVCGA